MVALFIFVIGLVVGSFIGMLSFRLPRGITLSGRSKCDTCRKVIGWRENIPVLSFLFL